MDLPFTSAAYLTFQLDLNRAPFHAFVLTVDMLDPGSSTMFSVTSVSSTPVGATLPWLH
jgi:hypothetical protein